jgi:hypothetical protein
MMAVNFEFVHRFLRYYDAAMIGAPSGKRVAFHRARSVVRRLRYRKVNWWGDAFGGHVTQPPDAQATLDVFAGEWASRLPAPFDQLRAGESELFADSRVAWALRRFGSLAGYTVLDLGPLECGHTYMAIGAGASRVVAVEGNARHFLRCLLVKDLLNLQAVDLLLGDFVGYLRRNEESFDLCLAMGVLYHMTDPVELIALTAKRASRLVLWTHYYDDERIACCEPSWRRRFVGSKLTDAHGFVHTQYRFKYGVGRRLAGFYGGNDAYANWLSRDELLSALRHFGWRDIEIGPEDREDPRGPHLTLTAVRDHATVANAV